MANEQHIRELAYRLWEQAGSPEGRDAEFWSAAAQQLAPTQAALDAVQEADEESFPASDPPSFTPGTGAMAEPSATAAKLAKPRKRK